MERRLYRTRDGKMVAGVSTGLAEYFNLDPVLIRLLFVIFTFFNGVGILAYVILWIVVPYRPIVLPAASTGETTEAASIDLAPPPVKVANGKSSMFTGVLLIALGVLFLLNNFVPGFSFGDFWPLLLIGIGGALLANAWPSTQREEVQS